MRTNKKYAAKQFPKQKQQIDSTAKVELLIYKRLYDFMEEVESHPGLESVAKLIDHIEDNKDFWLIYELGGQSLSKLLFDVKGEFYKGERIYFVNHQQAYLELR